MPDIKRILTGLAYSLDYGADPATATWTEITYGRIFADGSELFGDEVTMVDLIGGGKRVTATDGSATYAITYRDTDTNPDPEVAALRTALDAGTPVWIRETYASGDALVCGGSTGCYGGSSIVPSGRGTFLVEAFAVSAPGADVGDTFTVVPAA